MGLFRNRPNDEIQNFYTILSELTLPNKKLDRVSGRKILHKRVDPLLSQQQCEFICNHSLSRWVVLRSGLFNKQSSQGRVKHVNIRQAALIKLDQYYKKLFLDNSDFEEESSSETTTIVLSQTPAPTTSTTSVFVPLLCAIGITSNSTAPSANFTENGKETSSSEMFEL